MAIKGDYLRVETPITSDGVSPVTNNGQVQYREDHLPLSSKKYLEAKNQRLPEYLRKRITVVSNQAYSTTEVDQPTSQKSEKRKGGRPSKNVQQ
jgi:hypothetical protein